ncbi:uncharacterized protein DUF5019 [Balneicella halophila]|uniref:Uncharacterized protein DUF5019 n=1 Tax=Balneicella halophila TaxID=1537566 RepID=A0A7L4UPR5_BALHA|nr:SusF/SusE family outer membrane protein [Balneicella halophila]PVX51768.1 uncharacterized protein DUF5019 [Balneicella halophila]
MKKFIKNALWILAATLFLAACSDDVDPILGDNTVAPEITAPADGNVAVLLKTDEENLFEVFEWTVADFNLDVVNNYRLEMDFSDANFEKAKTLITTTNLNHTFTVGAFNKALLDAGLEAEKTYTIQLRVVANNYLHSEPITMTVTPYFDVDKWTLIGSAVGGWNLENDQAMKYDSSNETYYLELEMKPGEFKFRAPQKDPSDPWANNMGLNKDNPELVDNGSAIGLKSGGANIKVSGGNYKVRLNVKDETFDIEQTSVAEFTDWTEAKLDAVGTGVSGDNENATADNSGWNWGNVLLADNDGLPAKDGAIYTWTWEGIILETNEGFKLRTLNGEPASNDISFDVGFGVIDVENSTDKVVDAGGNISVSEKGVYNITLTIDAVNGDVKKVIISTPPPKYPEQLFMIGDGVGDWDWNNTDLPMIPVNGTPNLFWKVVWMNETGGFKFAPEKAWGQDFGGDSDAVQEEYAKAGNNIPVPGTAGYYMVVVDLNANKISIAEPKVYLMGNTIGSWDMYNEAGLFTVDNVNEKITITKTLQAGELRMYVSHPYFPENDWWRTEFMILDGVIVPRGNGGDQERVNVAGVETTIDLNFKTMTGSISQ